MTNLLSPLKIQNAIDAHLHPWRLNNIPAVLKGAEKVRPDLFQDYPVNKVVATAKVSGFSSVILVHVRDPQDNSITETDWFIEAAKENPEVVAAVIGIDLLDPSGSEKMLSAFKNRKLIRGVRMIAPENHGVGILADARTKDTLKLLGNLGLTWDLLIRSSNPGQIKEAVTIVEWAAKNTKTTIVGDHLFKPLGLAEGKPHADWLNALKQLSSCSNFYMKISGLPGDVPPGTNNQKFRPFYEAALENLGEDKLLFGSDHPVSFGHKEAVAAVVDWLTSTNKKPGLAQKIFSENARKAYRL